MTIGIMGAMPEEIENIKSHMTEVRNIEHGSRTYYLGKLRGHDVVVVFSRWGKVAASCTTTSLITEFNVEKILFTGVAGGASTELEIGDIVVSDKLYQHDLDARPIMPRFGIPLTNLIYLEANKDLTEKALSAANTVLNEQHIPKDILKSFDMKSPKAINGLIGTGDQFITDINVVNALLEEQPDTKAIEMEGAAVAQVCTDYDIPFVVIRTISDKANKDAHLDYPKFVSEVAAHYSEYIILEMLKGDF